MAMIMISVPLTRCCPRAPWYQASVIMTGMPRMRMSVNIRSKPCDQFNEPANISAPCSRV